MEELLPTAIIWGGYLVGVLALGGICFFASRSIALVAIIVCAAVAYPYWELTYGRRALAPICAFEKRVEVFSNAAPVESIFVDPAELCVTCLVELLQKGYAFIELDLKQQVIVDMKARGQWTLSYQRLFGDQPGFYRFLPGAHECLALPAHSWITAQNRHCLKIEPIAAPTSTIVVKTTVHRFEQTFGTVNKRELIVGRRVDERVFARQRDYAWIPTGILGRHLNPRAQPRFLGYYDCSMLGHGVERDVSVPEVAPPRSS